MAEHVPRTKPAAERRTDLMDAAEKLVLSRGADSFTIEDVTVGAGVAKGTFYLHFSNKCELLDALRERYVQRFAAAQLSAARKARGPASIQTWMRAGVAEYLRDVRLHDVLFHTTTRGDGAKPNAVIDTLAELLAKLPKPPPDPQTTALILYSAMHGVTDYLIHQPDHADRLMTGLDQLVAAVLG